MRGRRPAGGWRPPHRPADTRPRARSFGQPGGWRRERYLTLMREWVGRGAELADPYDPALVRTAPRELKRLLADALSEEATARIVADLGMGYRELGYISIPELLANGAELDLHYRPKTIGEILA